VSAAPPPGRLAQDAPRGPGAPAGWAALAAALIEDAPLDPGLIDACERAALAPGRPLRFATPSFKSYDSDALAPCGRRRFPAFSVTGPACGLGCDHCRAAILAPMIPATTPAALDAQVRAMAADGALGGFLLSGGSNRRNEIAYDRFLPTVARLKRDLPALRIAVHTGLLDAARARALAEAGIDTAMMDVIGAAATIRDVYHLDRPVADFEATLAALCTTPMEVVPHIVLGLHYGRLLGEAAALDIVARHAVAALVLVVVMPGHARPGTFVTPDPAAVGRFFLAARRRLQVPVLLGCARPPGRHRRAVDAYAVMAGLDAIAYPDDGAVMLAQALGRPADRQHACCAVGAGGGRAGCA
jgi:uncharacterized radical SAM superfamily protein